jgi:methyl-accepting chemotaxis protein
MKLRIKISVMGIAIVAAAVAAVSLILLNSVPYMQIRPAAEQAQTAFTIMAIMIVVLIAALIIFIASGFITKPLRNITGTLKAISKEEWDMDKLIAALESIAIKENDETADLAKYFNHALVKTNNTLMVTLKEQASALLGLCNLMTHNMTETAATINKIVENSQHIKSRTINQSSSITETKTEF